MWVQTTGRLVGDSLSVGIKRSSRFSLAMVGKYELLFGQCRDSGGFDPTGSIGRKSRWNKERLRNKERLDCIHHHVQERSPY